MASKKFTKKMFDNETKEIYYNNDLVSQIKKTALSGNLEVAYKLANKYIDDYPRDGLGPFYLAQVLVLMDRKEEAVEVAKNAFENSQHNHKTTMKAYELYVEILYDCNKKEECMPLLYEAIQKDINSNSDEELYRVYTLFLGNLFKDRLYEKAYDYSIKFYEITKNDLFRMYEAKALNYMHKPFEANRILLSISFEDALSEQHRNYVLGNTYLTMLDYKNDGKYIDMAEEAYRKALTKKTSNYYDAIIRLCTLDLMRDNYIEASDYANIIIEYGKAYNDEYYIYEGYKYLSTVALETGQLKECKEYLDKVPLDKRLSLTARYLYSIGKYEEAAKFIESNEELIYDDPGINALLLFHIHSYIRLKDYDKAEELTEKYQPYILDAERERVYAFIRHYKGLPHEKYRFYTSRQLVEYDEEKAIDHICEGHLGKRTLSFVNRKAIIDIMRETKDKIVLLNPIPVGLMDKYIVRFDKVDIVGDKTCYAVAAIVIPDTTNIITLYPILSSRSTYKSEHKSKEIKVRSGLDRFNARYGNKN